MALRIGRSAGSFEFRYSLDNDEAATALASYTLVALNIEPAAPDVIAWSEKLNLAMPSVGMNLAIFDSSGKLAAQSTDAELSTNGKLDEKKLIAFLNRYAPAYPDAQKLYDAALAQARQQDKRVLFDESSAGCGWCVKLGEYFEANQSLIDKDFVPLTIDWRFPHAKQVIERLHPRSEGTPWMAILNRDGHIVITSTGPDGNIGYPGEPAGRQWWEKMLHAGAKRLTDADVQKLTAALKS